MKEQTSKNRNFTLGSLSVNYTNFWLRCPNLGVLSPNEAKRYVSSGTNESPQETEVNSVAKTEKDTPQISSGTKNAKGGILE